MTLKWPGSSLELEQSRWICKNVPRIKKQRTSRGAVVAWASAPAYCKASNRWGEADGWVCYSRVSRQHWKCCPLLPFRLMSQNTTTPTSRYYPESILFLQSSRSFSVSMTPHPLPANDSTHPSWKLSSAIAPSIRVTLGTQFFSNYWNWNWQSITQDIWGQPTEYLIWGIFSGSWVRCLGYVAGIALNGWGDWVEHMSQVLGNRQVF